MLWLFAAPLLLLSGILALALLVAICALSIKVKKMKAIADKLPHLPDGEGKAYFRKYREDAFAHYMAATGGSYTFSLDNIVATVEPSLIKSLLTKPAHTLGRSWLYSLTARLLPYSYGILFAAHDDWKRRHKAFTPIFGPPNLRQYSTDMFDCALVESIATHTKQKILRQTQMLVDAAAGDAEKAAICAKQSQVLQDAVRTLRTSPATFGIDNILDTHCTLHIELDQQAPGRVTLSRTLVQDASKPWGQWGYEGPHTSGDLLTFMRSMAIRTLFSWGLGLNAAGTVALMSKANGDSSSAQKSDFAAEVSAVIARTVDDYTRTALERMPHQNALGWVSGYAYLWKLKYRIRKLVETALTLGPKSDVSDVPLAALSEFFGDNRNAVRQAVAQGQASMEQPRQPPSTFVTAMKDAGFTVDEIGSELNHVHGAHKAVAFTATACLFELSLPCNQKWRAAVVEELTRVCGKPREGEPMGEVLKQAWSRTAGWRVPERADFETDQLPVTQRVWKETLRLHVVSLGTMRVTGEPIVDPATGVELPTGTDVQILLHRLHTHPDFWPNPELFDPDRWLPDSPNAAKRSDVYFPFLDGQRRCAGLHLAEVQFLSMMYVSLVLMDVRVDLSESDWEEREPYEANVSALSDVRLRHPQGPRHTAIRKIPAVKSPQDADMPQSSKNGDAHIYKLRMRPDMFSAYDGRIPFTMQPQW